jgi:probable rRNA maturation factor
VSHAVEVRNDTRFAVDLDAVEALVRAVLRAEGVLDGELGVRLVGERRMRAVNLEFRDEDAVTDVLAFPLEDDEDRVRGGGGEAGVPPRMLGDVIADAPPRMLGDVIVCMKRAERQAAAAGLPLSIELAVLLVHGVLHLLGHDHEADAGAMATRQVEVLEVVSWEGLVGASR